MIEESLGLNEALILTALALCGESSIADLAQCILPIRDIDDGSIYMALRRMTAKGFVIRRSERVVSADNRTREIGKYKILAEGQAALRKFEAAQSAVPRLRLALGGA